MPSVNVNDLPPAPVNVNDLPPAPDQPNTPQGGGGKPDPGENPDPMTNYYPNSGDFYPNPDAPGSGGGPHAAGITMRDSLGAFGTGLSVLLVQNGVGSYRVAG